jgi:Cytochrome c554 and c-prime
MIRMMENQANPPADRRYVPLVVAAFFVTLLVGGGYFALRGALPQGLLACGGTEESELPPLQDDAGGNFANWEKPLVAIVVSGQMHGYINPCGCSSPQNGGLERRYNFIESLKAKGWDVVGIDLGELPETKGIQEQNMLKYELSVKALRAMNYKVIGIGRDEFRAGLDDLLVAAWDGKKQPRPLLMSLADPGKHYAELNVRPFEVIADTTPKIGVINMMGPHLCDEIDPKPNPAKPKFLDNRDELPKALAAFAKDGVEIGVILQHEYPKVGPNLGGIQAMQAIEKERRKQALTCAEFCAKERQKNAKIPAIQLMMHLIEDPEPPFFMTQLDPKLPTHVVEIGHKGKYVGLIGVYRDKNGYRLSYQKILMSEDWLTPEAKKAKQPVIALMEKYQLALKSQDMLAKAPRTLHFNQIPARNQKGLAATYVGSDRCSGCHKHAHAVWSESKHAKAMETLEKAKFPSNRHYDPECVKCHTTGFQNPGGYNDFVPVIADWPAPPKQKPARAKVVQHNADLRGVGCESCHGPASEHVKNTRDANIHKLINPYKPTPAERKLEDALVKNPKDANSLQQWLQLSEKRRRAIEANHCIKCHDQENDVHWGNKGTDIVARWLLDPKQRLIHHSPNNNGAANPPAAKDAVVPALAVDPPLVIEVVPEKKQ